MYSLFKANLSPQNQFSIASSAKSSYCREENSPTHSRVLPPVVLVNSNHLINIESLNNSQLVIENIIGPSGNSLEQHLDEWVNSALEEQKIGRLFIKKKLISQGAVFSTEHILIDKFSLEDFSEKFELPKNLVIKNLSIKNCLGLLSIEDIVVCKNLYIENCYSLKYLPNALDLKGTFYLHDCPAIVALPEVLRIKGNLYIVKCHGITHLSDTIDIGLDIRIDSEELISFPENFLAKQNLELRGCTKLECLSNLTVVGNLDLSYSGIVEISSVTVYGDSNISHCTSLKNFMNFIIYGDADFTRCVNLGALSENVHVEGNLILKECYKLNKLPQHITSFGDIDFQECHGLNQLPQWIIELGTRHDGGVRHIHLEGTGLSSNMVYELVMMDPYGIEFHYNHRFKDSQQEQITQQRYRKQNALNFNWNGLAKNAKSLVDEAFCVISQEPFKNLKNPIFLITPNASKAQVFERDDLVRWWIRHGSDPTTHQPFQLSDLRKLS